MNILKKTLIVFDVESAGLHGEGWAVGAVVLVNGIEVESLRAVAPLDTAWGDPDGFKFCRENIPPMEPTVVGPRDVRTSFWNLWRRYCVEQHHPLLFAECAWPVEARFLAQCVDDMRPVRYWEGPYPLHDVASIILASGGDPMAKQDRLPNELPIHEPLADARQSARLLVEALKRLTPP